MLEYLVQNYFFFSNNEELIPIARFLQGSKEVSNFGTAYFCTAFPFKEHCKSMKMWDYCILTTSLEFDFWETSQGPRGE